MKHIFPLILFALMLGGCAAYKELTPEPPLSPAERGYVELKSDQENFKLDKDGKYFIKFPRPERDQFVLVLKMNAKSFLRQYLTNAFDDGKEPIQRIPDETASNDSISVYAFDAASLQYYWVIDSVKADIELVMSYRYAPRWRWTFENKYEEYQNILANNTVDRSVYNSINRSFSFSGFPFTERMSQLEGKTGNVRSMREELAKLERIFPPNIASSRDTAYLNYAALRDRTQDELQFQENYAAVLKVFKKEQETGGDMRAFLEAAPMFTDFLSRRGKYPVPIQEKATDVFLGRLAGAAGFFDDQLRAKNDARRITFTPPLENAVKLYEACGSRPPAEFSALSAFVDRFNAEASAMGLVGERFRQIDRGLDANTSWGSEPFYTDLVSKVNEIRAKLPDSRTPSFEKYGRYQCATMLDAEIRNAAARTSASEVLFSSGLQFAQQLNANAWSAAEGTLRSLFQNTAFAGTPSVNEQKNRIVRGGENELFNRVKQISHQRVDAFVKAHEAAIDNVPALYLDSAFIPVHSIGWSSLGDAEAQRRRSEVQNYIDKLKFNDFPAASIKAIYRDFTRNINDRGVDRARAIVEHGKYYRGDDRQIKSMVDECNPQTAKWITKPKEYRKLYALPVTSNTRGVNEYMFRVLLRIPSEAQFPVFEINIKLPKEVAEKAGSEQWYESIKINRTLIKNEGRFTITAPTASNDYESQVSPVQMDKDGNNVLEVRFKFPGYKVFEVSTMAQVPIIRKN